MFGWPIRHAKREKNLRLKIDVIVEPDGDGFYAYAPALKGLHAFGESEKEAVEHALDGVFLYINSLDRHGDPLPIGKHLAAEEHEEHTHTLHTTPISKSVTFEWPSNRMCGIS